MSSEIDANEVKVGKLFGPDFIFNIPIYQRPLSWDEDNYDQLFEDLYDAVSNDEAQYFLGSIILHKENDINSFAVVDGQQRLSALAILMAVIRDVPITNIIPKLKNNLNSYLYQDADEHKMIPEEMRIVPWEDLKDIFKKYIYTLDMTNVYRKDIESGHIKFTDKDDPKYHLYEAITIFHNKVNEKLSDALDLDRFVKYLLNRVSMVSIITNNLPSAFRLFNVLNTRGLRLSTSDLLKSENIGVISEEPLRLKYATIWRDIEISLGREELENIISFIRTMQLKDKAQSGVYDEFRKRIFEEKRLQRGKEFIDYVKDVSEIFSEKILEGHIIGSSLKTNEYKSILKLLTNFVPFSDWIPPVLKFYYKFRDNDSLYNFILKLEKKVIIEWTSGFSYTERITSLNRLLDLIDIEGDPHNIVNQLIFYRDEKGKPTRTLDFSNKEILSFNLAEKLDDSQFYSTYRGKLAKYVLLRIDMDYWDMENFPGYPGTVTLEHILPQNPDKDSEWRAIFDDQIRKEWTNKLGNLVLLSGVKNTKAQNYDFAKKKTVYFQEKSTPFQITQKLQTIDKWTFSELKERHDHLINTAKKIFLNY